LRAARPVPPHRPAGPARRPAARPAGMTAPTRRITVLGTGGTVAARSDAAGVLAPATVPADLLSGVPVPGHVAVSAREVMAVDSAALSLDDMGLISDAAADALAGGSGG